VAEPELARKLQVKPGTRVLVLDAPDAYLERLGDPAETEPRDDAAYDVVQVFVKDRLDVERRAAAALRALRPGGVLWFSYPKRSSKVATDLTRDHGWDVVARAGLRPVAQVSVDEVWSDVRPRSA
jgi:SAM-dependent methyltransferase